MSGGADVDDGDTSPTKRRIDTSADEAANLGRFRRDIEDGREWAVAMVDAMARWSSPEDTFRGKRVAYFIAGEAFDWPLLAQRLCGVAGALIPDDEREDLLLRGRIPLRLSPRSLGDLMKERLGVEKYRAYLNFHYGVTVEEALQHAVEEEVRKENAARGARYRTDESDVAFERLYGESPDELLAGFRADTGVRLGRGLSLRQGREFTYWLFGYRVGHSDKAKMASDTKKGLNQLARLAAFADARSVRPARPIRPEGPAKRSRSRQAGPS